MSQAIDIALPRICSAAEEGFRAKAYNDATGATVTCQPGGNLTWLYGCNLETEGCPELGQVIVRWKLGKIEAQLLAYPWYAGLDPARQSVCLDIAFNGGVNDLLHYPHMIAALAAKDWVTAKANCTAVDPRLKGRYDALGVILLNGQ